MLLAMTRGIGVTARQQGQSVWKWTPVAELSGMTLGVLGLGVIGEGVARRAAGFGMGVIGTKSHPGDYSGVAAEVFPPEQTLEVFRRADVVVITLPGGDATRHLVGEAELEALRGGWLVNVGRGPVVDEVALVAAMQQGVLAGVALDVFETEPLPADSPLWSLPGVLITPLRRTAGGIVHQEPGRLPGDGRVGESGGLSGQRSAVSGQRSARRYR
jgi:phosphoglycerate dehydrogenase-like enzyme